MENRGGKATAFSLFLSSFFFRVAQEKIDEMKDKISLPPCGLVQCIFLSLPISPGGFMPYRQAGSQAIASPFQSQHGETTVSSTPATHSPKRTQKRLRKVIEDVIIFYFAIYRRVRRGLFGARREKVPRLLWGRPQKGGVNSNDE
ncbi:MAG: hypothetical protein AB1656_04415 [Candidatus Omnitrophota bacterium]